MVLFPQKQTTFFRPGTKLCHKRDEHFKKKTLFPTERDQFFKLIIRAPEAGPLYGLEKRHSQGTLKRSSKPPEKKKKTQTKDINPVVLGARNNERTQLRSAEAEPPLWRSQAPRRLREAKPAALGKTERSALWEFFSHSSWEFFWEDKRSIFRYFEYQEVAWSQELVRLIHLPRFDAILKTTAGCVFFADFVPYPRSAPKSLDLLQAESRNKLKTKPLQKALKLKITKNHAKGKTRTLRPKCQKQTTSQEGLRKCSKRSPEKNRGATNQTKPKKNKKTKNKTTKTKEKPKEGQRAKANRLAKRSPQYPPLYHRIDPNDKPRLFSTSLVPPRDRHATKQLEINEQCLWRQRISGFLTDSNYSLIKMNSRIMLAPCFWALCPGKVGYSWVVWLAETLGSGK